MYGHDEDVPRRNREELEREDRVRDSKLARLKRALSKSSRRAKSISSRKSISSMRSQV